MIIVVVFIDGVLLGGMLPIPLYPCSPTERVVFFEFPQYDGARHWPVNGYALEGSCAVYFDIPDSQEQVYEYYSEQLEENGWMVEGERKCTGYAGKCPKLSARAFGTNSNIASSRVQT